MRLKLSRSPTPVACSQSSIATRRRPRWQAWHIVALGLALTAGFVTMTGVRPSAAQFNSFRHDPRVILEGTWQSCQDRDGSFTERVYDHVVNGVGQFEVHMGPAHEFAIFPGVQDEHRGHALEDNLLKPYRVPMVDGRATHTWKIPSLGLTFTVALGGGSFTDCDNWYLTLSPDAPTGRRAPEDASPLGTP